MSVAAGQRAIVQTTVVRHPNEFDTVRIARDLGQRSRYRYVEPRVLQVEHGYLVRSACCSRNIDATGCEIDVALIEWDAGLMLWHLFRRDHAAAVWLEDSRHHRLTEAVARVNADPRRQFWQ